MVRLLGTAAAMTLTTVAVTGIVALILLDFPGVPRAFVDGLRGLFTPAEVSSTDLLDEVDSITLFMREPIERSDLQISTGASFASAADIAERNPSNMWCYVRVGDDNVSRHVDLGSKRPNGTPVYTDLSGIDPADERALGLTGTRLMRLAKSHCRFDDFDPFEAGN